MRCRISGFVGISTVQLSRTRIDAVVLAAASFLAVDAVVVTLNWDVTWVWAAPDGFGRPVIGINNQWPPPPIHVNLNDRLVLQLRNKLGNETTALHFHGQNQGKSSQMEGAAGVTQCPLPPGMTMTYDFICKQTGTHWYHSHMGGSYLDGFRAALIVHNTAAPYANSYDEEIIMTVSDWYHKEAPYLNVQFPFIPSKRYLFRIINMSGFASNVISFEGQTMTIVEMDGVATVPTVTDKIKIATAQRYVVIVTALPTATQNFGILSAMDPGMFSGDALPADYNPNATAYMVYDSNLPLPPQPQISDFTAINEFNVQPFDQGQILGPVTQPVVLNFDFAFVEGMSRGTMNGTTYVPQIVPTLYTALSAPPQYVSDPRIYSANSNTVIFNNPLGITEILISNNDAGAHPFHIHGHIAQIVAQGPPGTPSSPSTFDGVYAQIPARRDVFMVNPNSYTIIRFKTGNPGIWLLHCHIEWHIEAGLVMTFVEDPVQLQAQNLSIPQNMYDACAAQGIPTVGNAGGDSTNWLNLKDAPTKPPKKFWGTLITPPSPAKNNGLGNTKRDLATRMGSRITRN